jgi:hypothetical protein
MGQWFTRLAVSQSGVVQLVSRNGVNPSAPVSPLNTGAAPETPPFRKSRASSRGETADHVLYLLWRPDETTSSLHGDVSFEEVELEN